MPALRRSSNHDGVASTTTTSDYVTRSVRRRVGFAALNRLHAEIEAERTLEALHARSARRWAWGGAAAFALLVCLL